MTDVEVPGVGIVEFPDSMSRNDIQSALQKLTQQAAPGIPEPIKPELAPDPEPSSALAFSQSALRTFLDNALGLPQTVSDLLLAPTGLRGDLQIPEANELAAAGRALEMATGAITRGEVPEFGRLFTEARGRIEQEEIRERQESPIASTLGRTTGDIATLLAGRAPIRAAAAGAAPARAAETVELGAQTILGNALKGLGRGAKKTAGRAARTGAEAAFLATLQDADPAEAGAIAAAIETGAAPLRGGIKFLTTSKLGTALLLGGFVSLGIQQFTPGGLNRILPTLEEVNKKAFLAVLLGAGAGAVTGEIPERFAGPAFGKLATVVKRGALLSLLNSAISDPVRTAPVIQKFSEDPDFFGPQAKRLLTRAINTEKIDVRTTVERLMENRQFRRRFEALTN